MDNENVNSSEMTDEQMDGLISGESTSHNIPEHSDAPAPVQEYTLKVNGKEVKAPIDKVLQWAQMGYDYPQKAQALKAQEAEWQKTLQEKEEYYKGIEQKWAPYKQVDEYAAKNPDWWSSAQEQYKQKMAEAQTNPEISAIKNEIEQIKQFKSEMLAKEQSAKIEKEDADLNKDIDIIKKQNPNIDFDSADEEGSSLQMKVLKHAVDNGITNFRVAFRDYYHDHLLSKAKDEGKEIVSRDIQKRTKLGILSESSKPSKGFTVASNVKSKSYNDLVQEALGELTGG